MPDLTSKLIVQLLDKTGDGSKSAVKNLKAVEQEVSKTDRIKAFRGIWDEFKSSRGGYMDAKRNIERIARDLRDARKMVEQFDGKKFKKTDIIYGPLMEMRTRVKELEREYKAARRSVSSAAGDFEQQAQRIKTAWGGIGKLNFDGLISEERRLREEINLTTQAATSQAKALTPGRSVGQRLMGMGRAAKGVAGRIAAIPGRAVAAIQQSPLQALAYSYTAQAAARYAYDNAYYANKIQGRAGWTPEQVADFSSYARQQALTTGLTGTTGANGMMAMGEIFGKAGISQQTAKGLLLPALQFARFGDISDEEAANAIIRGATTFKLPMATTADANKSARRIADSMAFAANKTLADVTDVADVYRIAGPIAQAMGFTPEQTAALAGSFIQSGLHGNETGTAIRSGFVRFIKPTKDSRQALAELGMSVEGYATGYRPVSADELISGMTARFGPMKSDVSSSVSGVLSKDYDTQAGLAAALSRIFEGATGAKGAQDKEKVADAINAALTSTIKEIDVERFIKDLTAKNPTAGQVARIFDQRQGARWLAGMGNQGIYNDIAQGLIGGDGVNASERGAKIMMQGVVGEWNKFMASLQELVLTAADAGAIRSATDILKELSRAIQSLATAGKWLDENFIPKSKMPGGNWVAEKGIQLRHGIQWLWNHQRGRDPRGKAIWTDQDKLGMGAANIMSRGDYMNAESSTIETKVNSAPAKGYLEMLKEILSVTQQINAIPLGMPFSSGGSGYRSSHADILGMD